MINGEQGQAVAPAAQPAPQQPAKPQAIAARQPSSTERVHSQIGDGSKKAGLSTGLLVLIAGVLAAVAGIVGGLFWWSSKG